LGSGVLRAIDRRVTVQNIDDTSQMRPVSAERVEVVQLPIYNSLEECRFPPSNAFSFLIFRLSYDRKHFTLTIFTHMTVFLGLYIYDPTNRTDHELECKS